MITLTDIETAQSKIGAASDFPQYIQDLKKLGIQKFSTLVENSQSVYWQKGGEPIVSAWKYKTLTIASKTDENTFVECLKMHQEGRTDYFTFCEDCAKSGIERWVMDLDQMTCTYIDHSGHEILVENVPTVS